MSDNNGQHIQVEIQNCICGNTTSDEGLMTCDSNGMIACYCGDQRHAKSSNSTLVTFPESNADTFTLCPSCGRVYSDQDFIEGKRTPAFQVNLTEPYRVLNLGDHDEEMDGL